MYPFWWVWKKMNLKYGIDRSNECYVVLGFPRSGTSLVSRLVNHCGVSFGNSNKFKPSDWRNPKGFYEYSEIIKLDEKLVSQAGLTSPHKFDNDISLRAKGILNRIRRIFTRRRMILVLNEISSPGKKWGFKEFPSTFYFWETYVPQCKVVAVYRDPLSNAYSARRTFKRYTYRQIIEQWTASNKELLYHISTKDSIVIKLEDLTDKEKQKNILKKLTEFIGSGSVDELEKLIEPFVSDSVKYVDDLKMNYPLNDDTKMVLDILNCIKI